MTVSLAPDEVHAIVAAAARAPSVHNIQPARWRFESDGSVVLFRALDRALPVADPTGHDVQASLGAAFEAMSMALSARGISLGAPLGAGDVMADGCEPVVRASLEQTGRATDPLEPWLAVRRSFRGRFLPADAGQLARLNGIAAADARLVAGGEALRALAALHDAATWTFESRADYHRELWSWLRLSPRDPDYHRDGLNADCLALSAAERWAAARLLAPGPFALLGRLGIARPLISEGASVRSASAAVVFCPLKRASAFDVGRRMLRLWLEVEAAGLHLAPMSACADDARVRPALERLHGVPAERRLANVFRVGRMDDAAVAVSPRLPVDEYLV
ncbi:MAG: hypothetical protein ABJA80_03065 [bacterium]